MRVCLSTLVMLLAVACGAGENFSFRDDFSKYAAGSDGAPAWTAEGIDWEVRDKAFRCDDPERDQVWVGAAPLAARVVAQADVCLDRASGKEWKVAGVCVRKDERNYWHLALMESPDANGKNHAVELCEMLSGTWLAMSGAASRLVEKEALGRGFQWLYNHTYRLKIELSPDGIVGTVAETDGTVRSRIRYEFGAAPAAKSGRPGLTVAGFAAAFSSFSCESSQPVAEEIIAEKAIPRYDAGPLAKTALKGKATGFFHVEERDGRWWTIDPLGNAFFVIGTDHPNYQAHWCEKLGYAPYHKNCEKKYGGEAKWGDSTLERLNAWGFNALGTNPSQSITRRGLPHPEFLGFGTHFATRDFLTPKTTWTGFPNVFSPKWPRYCDQMARRRCAPLKNDPWVLGYFIDNELEWHAWTGGGLFENALKKPANDSAKLAVVELLKQRHATVEDLNAAWGTQLKSLDELLTTRELKAGGSARATDAAKADVTEFMRRVAEKYFGIASAAIRRHDPNHMVLGCRFAGSAPEIVDVAGKYSDIFTINCYRKIDLARGLMADGFEEELARWHDQCKRPMMITEWSFPALDAGLPCKHGAGQRVPTQADKAFCFTVFQKLLLSTPYMVGSNYFMWADEPALGISSTFPEDSNYGLVNEQDEPYALLTQAATKLHAVAERIHAGQFSDCRIVTDPDPGTRNPKPSFVVRNFGTFAASVRATLWLDGKPREEQFTLEPNGQREIAPPAATADAPGGHLAVCRVQTAEPMLERNSREQVASRIFYTRGTPWRVDGTQRVPVVVGNPTDADINQEIVVIAKPDGLNADANGIRVVDEAGAVVPAQLDQLEGGAQAAIRVEKLPANSARLYFVIPATGAGGTPAVRVSREGESGLEIDNGVLRVSRGKMSGNAFDKVSVNGAELGRFAPVLHQITPQSFWTHPQRVENVRISSGPVRLVAEMTFAADRAGGTPAVRTMYRFVFEPGRPWFRSQFLWIENSDSATWNLGGYFHYATPTMRDCEAHSNYWLDPASKLCYGILTSDPAINVYFWKDPEGHPHPDAVRKLQLDLKPRERFAATEPSVFVVGCKQSEWPELQHQIETGHAPLKRMFELELRN